MIDTHCHLFDEAFDNDREELIKNITLSGVSKLIIVGFSDDTNLKAYELSSKYDFMYPTCGIHPSEADSNPDILLENLEKFISEHKVYAIGECGLDYYWDKTYVNEQKYLFRYQIELAKRLDLPIIVHCRDAIQDCYDILNEYKPIRGVMHCYSGSLEMAHRFIELGMYISLGGPVTFKNAKEPKHVAKNIDINRLLIETDCPYLAPTPMRGKRNDSSYLKYILNEIANIRNIDTNTLETILDRNSLNLFRLE